MAEAEKSLNDQIEKVLKDGVTEAELLTMVEAVHGGDIKDREKQLIHNIFEFSDTRVSEVMTPRADMFVVDAENPPSLETIFRSNFSRIPVIDEIVTDDRGSRMFVCSDTDFCESRQAAGHRGTESAAPHKESAHG